MIVGSTKEDLTSEKRISLTPETAKNIIGLGLKVCIEKNYANHLGIDDDQFKAIGVEIKSSSNEVINSSNLIIKVNCPSENEISILRDRLLPAATGHIHTTINTLEDRLKECQAELDKGKCNG